MRLWRLVLGVLGGLVVAYGVVNLGLTLPTRTVLWVGVCLVAAVIIHHGLLSPVVVAIGVLLRRLIPDRGRRYVQAALVMAAPVSVIALPMIYRQGSQPPSKALLLQNFTANLGVLLGVIAALFLVGYAVRVARHPSVASRRPPSP